LQLQLLSSFLHSNLKLVFLLHRTHDIKHHESECIEIQWLIYKHCNKQNILNNMLPVEAEPVNKRLKHILFLI
jgi:hypothetical protein